VIFERKKPGIVFLGPPHVKLHCPIRFSGYDSFPQKPWYSRISVETRIGTSVFVVDDIPEFQSENSRDWGFALIC